MTVMGNRIKDKRIEKGLTMAELADALGIKASAVNKYEKGIVENIKRSTIQQMAKIFDCDPAWLMGFDDSKVEVPEYVPEIQDFISILPLLNKEQINSLLNTARLFVAQNTAAANQTKAGKGKK